MMFAIGVKAFPWTLVSSSEMLLPAALWRDRRPCFEIFLPFEATIKSINGCDAESLAVTICHGERFRLWELVPFYIGE